MSSNLGGKTRPTAAYTTKYNGTEATNDIKMAIDPRRPRQKQKVIARVKVMGNVNLIGSTEVFSVRPQAGHGNPLPSHIGI
jgi:hypothetical protein